MHEFAWGCWHSKGIGASRLHCITLVSPKDHAPHLILQLPSPVLGHEARLDDVEWTSGYWAQECGAEATDHGLHAEHKLLRLEQTFCVLVL